MSIRERSDLLGPFDWDWGKNLWLTGADVYYLAARHIVGLDGDVAEAVERLDQPVVYPNVVLPTLNLAHANLRHAHLERAVLRQTHLEEAFLAGVHLEQANLYQAHLAGVNLRGAYFDAATVIRQATVTDAIRGTISVADVRWQGVNLAVVSWRGILDKKGRKGIVTLGDERLAEESKTSGGAAPGALSWLTQLETAARANRQLAAAMREQGMNVEADQFAYRAQLLQRKIFGQQGPRWKWLFWCILQGLAGYGYRPLWTVGWYVAVLIVSTAVYCWQGAIVAHPHTPGAAILATSIVDAFTALHGRGFFPTPAESGWQMGMAAVDAVAGLLIEASFIATFTQRFFGR